VAHDDLDVAIDELFRLPPDRFVAQRDALAASLREDKRKEDAAAVKKLRRPTVAAWAVNRLADVDADRLTDLAALPRQIRDAQQAAVNGDPSAMRTTQRRRMELVGGLTDAALRAARDAGVDAEGSRRDVTGLREAASLDPSVAAEVTSGRLQRTVEPPSAFELPDIVAAPHAPAAPPEPQIDEQAVRAAETRLDAARRALDAAEADVRRLQGELDVARDERARARAGVDDAEAELHRARHPD
jgi:hypothetical protein